MQVHYRAFCSCLHSGILSETWIFVKTVESREGPEEENNFMFFIHHEKMVNHSLYFTRTFKFFIGA